MEMGVKRSIGVGLSSGRGARVLRYLLAWLAASLFTGCLAWELREAPPEIVLSGLPEQARAGEGFVLTVTAVFATRSEDVSDVSIVGVDPPDAAVIKETSITPARSGEITLRVEALGIVVERKISVAG